MQAEPVKIIGNPEGTITIDLGAPSRTFTLLELDEIISSLGRLRSYHSIDIPLELPEKFKGEASSDDFVTDPRFYIGASKENEVILFLRHPGFGWLAFLHPREEAEILRHRVQQALDRIARR